MRTRTLILSLVVVTSGVALGGCRYGVHGGYGFGYHGGYDTRVDVRYAGRYDDCGPSYRGYGGHRGHGHGGPRAHHGGHVSYGGYGRGHGSRDCR